MNKIYVKPYCRIAPYLVGIVLGYLIHVEKSNPSQSPLVSGQWMVCFLCSLYLLKHDREPDIVRRHSGQN